MNDSGKPYQDSILQWDTACQHFQNEFGFDPQEILTIDTIREMFAELVDNHSLSENASISLMYALYFLGYITLLEMMRAKDEDFEIGDLSDFYLILDAADDWANKASDADVLAEVAHPIIETTRQVMGKLNLVRS
jgi:hypothetical protein